MTSRRDFDDESKHQTASPAPIAHVDSGAWTIALLAISLTLAAAGLGGQWAKYHGHDRLLGLGRLLDADLERNIPTWFQASLMLASAGLLAIIASARRSLSDPGWGRWRTVAVVFAAASLDEIASVHERLVLPERLLGVAVGFQVWSWILPGILVVLLLVRWLHPFIRALPLRTRRQCVAAAAVFLAGAMGVEGLGGLWAMRNGLDNLVYGFITTIEELLETIGLVLFVRAWLGVIRETGAVALQVDAHDRATP